MRSDELQKRLHSILLILLLLFPMGLFFLLLDEKDEYQRILDSKNAYLGDIVSQIDTEFSPFFQLISTTALLAETLQQDVKTHETFLNHIFTSSRSSIIYGTGIWYEPGAFQSDMIRFGPYIRYDNPPGGSYSVTYEWNTPEYDYHNTGWYKKILQSDTRDIMVTEPYFDTDFTYISFGKPFFREGVKAGVITVDIILLYLEEFFSVFDLSFFNGVYLTTSGDNLIFTLKNSDFSKNEDQNQLLDSDGKFSIDNITMWYDIRDIEPYFTELESEDGNLKIYGIINPSLIYKEIFSLHGYRYVLFLFLWLAVLTFFMIGSYISRQKYENTALNDENILLKNEIEKRLKAESELQFLAWHDSVTNLQNLNWFYENTVPPSGEEDSRYVIQIYLDNIRELSLLLERRLIDGLLREFTERLIRTCPRSADQLRGNGFSFYIIAHEDVPGEASELAVKLLKESGKTIRLKSKNVRLKVRAGVSYFREARDLEHVMGMSETTLSENNSSKSDKIFYYNKEIEDKKAYIMALDAEMNQKGFIDELFLLYQPIVRMEDRSIAGVEALVRWNSSRFSRTISPVDFIPLAEENGHIINLGWFVIHQALEKLSGDLAENDWFISVNVSPLQFIESGFPEKMDRLLKHSGVAKSRLKLEITETSAASGIPFFWKTIDTLIKKNYRLAIDDFGTGESSFQRLYNFSFDTLKIDRSFIKNILTNRRNQQIFNSILQLGKTMDNIVIAEGIEEEEEHEFLTKIGLHYGQGYLYSRPVEMDKLL